VAQQVEQKETMAIQYTIEMRNMLNDMPVRDEIRSFLFKVWAEVLAVAGRQERCPARRNAGAEKPLRPGLGRQRQAQPRRPRTRDPGPAQALLQRLRQGMTPDGLAGSAAGSAHQDHRRHAGRRLPVQDRGHPAGPYRRHGQALANLEDFVSDDQSGDLPLDAESIELMLGIDASTIEVVADGGSKPQCRHAGLGPGAAAGNWFTLDHNGRVQSVQYAWRSERKQLHLFASTDGTAYLIQARRLAAYLQAGLLVPSGRRSPDRARHPRRAGQAGRQPRP
jgi:hypothetical protein